MLLSDRAALEIYVRGSFGLPLLRNKTYRILSVKLANLTLGSLISVLRDQRLHHPVQMLLISQVQAEKISS